MVIHGIARPIDRLVLCLAAVVGLTLLGCEGGPAAAPEPREPLRIAVSGEPSGLDPHLHADFHTTILLRNLYESLVAFDRNMHLVPALAESWENPDDLVWRFRLRRDVRFHDGKPFDAEDVRFSLDRVRGRPESPTAGRLVAIESVRVVDAHTVEVITSTPYPILLNKLASLAIVPAGSPPEIHHPIGTGPYRLTRYVPGERLELAAYAAYRGGPPAELAAEVRFISAAADRVRGLLAGSYDVITDLSPEDVAQLEIEPDFRIAARSSLLVEFLEMNIAVPPYDDPRLREAIDLALDRAALVDQGLLGYGEPVGQMVGPNVFGFAPAITPPERDLQQARDLLAAAGHPGGIDLTIELREGRTFEPIREQLAEAGIRLNPQPHPWSEMRARLREGVPFYLGGWSCESGDASDFLEQVAHSRDAARGYGASNFNRYSNPQLDALIDESGTMLNMVERRTVLQQAMAHLAADRAFLPLYTSHDLYGLRHGVRWEPRQDGHLQVFEMHR